MEKTFVMYENEKIVGRTLNEKWMAPYLIESQKAEFRELKKILGEKTLESKGPLKILDIGVGESRLPLLLSKEPIWEKTGVYVGFDNSKKMVEKSRKEIAKAKLADKVKALYFDAVDLGRKTKNEIFRHSYDFVLCTYFTAGNFKPDEIKLEKAKNGLILPYPKSCLSPNKKFVKIFLAARSLLKENGKIILGTTYIDSDSARTAQEKAYKDFGMTVISSKKDSFTATAEGFWSQRFTDKRLYDYFYWLEKEKTKFVALDSQKIARMVVVSK